MTPKRVQLRRTKGWRKPEGAVVVARPSRWGNPYRVGDTLDISHTCDAYGSVGHYSPRTIYLAERHAERTIDAKTAVWLYRQDLLDALTPQPQEHPEDEAHRVELTAALAELRGKDLACWCPLDQPCHADVLLDLANPETRP